MVRIHPGALMNSNKSTGLTWFLNGKYLDSAKVTVPISDLSVTRGYGAFDFLRTYQGKPFLLSEHLQRLSQSASRLGLKLPYSPKTITKVIDNLIAKNNLKEANIKIVLTGGLTDDGITPSGGSSFAIAVSPITIYPKDYFEKGVKIITVRAVRNIPEAKSLDYLQGVLAMIKANKKGAVEAVYVDKNENVLEATRSNLFAFFQNKLVTPKNNILNGVSRQVVMKVLAGKFPIVEENLALKKLLNASEVFITSSTKEVMPVVKMDDMLVGDGTVGKNTKITMRAFKQFTAQFANS